MARWILAAVMALLMSEAALGQVAYTAEGQGYYLVHCDGEQISQHVAEREAIESATNAAIAGGVCVITHPYRVTVEWSGTSSGTDDGTAATSYPVLSWDAPTTRADGSALDVVSGYRVGCGSAVDQYDHQAPASDAPFELGPDLLPTNGRWACAVQALDADGLASAWSEPVTFDW